MTDARSHVLPLGRLPAPDDRHLRRWSLTESTLPVKPTPVVLGINWYQAFDAPVLVGGSHWIGRGTSWGQLRGGHAVCLLPPSLVDTFDWWRFYDQGREGACVGYAATRMMTLLNRQRYDAPWLYHEARKVDDWAGENYSGTSVRAGMDVLRDQGHRAPLRPVSAAHGIAANRWATSVEDIAACLNPADPSRVLNAGYVRLLNSWGAWYPHLTRVPLEALHRLVFAEDGEATVVTDR
ncbi:MAG: hypothetical protein H0W42_11180 [Gemmatimonadaceae bacterium]|nr:hypothetical protein [Gemmatimonadaceae bacterium]